ncbi:MAG: type II secretion system protein GspK [Blastochloris sp.]|nr:type II secretion system protein GspK [Blastochloris sp.]
MSKKQNRAGARGSALLIVLWAIAIMSLTVLATVQLMDLGLSESASQSKNFKALQLAESGLALGLHPKLEKKDSHLKQDFGSGESFTVTLRSEGSRLNINTLLLNKDKLVLTSLCERWGVEDREISGLVDSLIDWVDEDELKGLNGAEKDDYERMKLSGYPPNRPFKSLEEMELLPAMAPLIKAKPDWKDFFTVWGDGRLDLNEAPSDLIAAVCEVGTVASESFVERRLGPDGKVDTKDDFVYVDMNQARTALGINEALFKNIENRITIKSEFRRIISVGKIGTYERSLAVVVRLNSNPVQYLTWIEY